MGIENQPKLQMVTITNTEKPSEKVVAKLNPTNVTVNRKVSWEQVKGDKSDTPAVEYTKGDPDTLSLELLFDTYEDKEDVYETYIQGLKALTQVPKGSKGKKKHPPKVMVVWGDKKFLNFAGVITKLDVKYTMFLPDGTPVRATASLSVQASKKARAKVPRPRRQQQEGGEGGGGSGGGGAAPAA